MGGKGEEREGSKGEEREGRRGERWEEDGERERREMVKSKKSRETEAAKLAGNQSASVRDCKVMFQSTISSISELHAKELISLFKFHQLKAACLPA